MPDAIIVAHGAPSDPQPQEARMHRLAADVARRLPGWRLRGATLAMPGALSAALAGMEMPIIYPFFMAEGWFTGRALPKALAACDAIACQIAPFGVDPGLPALTAEAALQGAAAAAIAPEHATLVLAAHGSQVSRSSANGAFAMAARLRGLTGFAEIRVGLIEEPPFLADAARGADTGLCLPFFALRAGHVETDIPQALAQAGFSGPLLPAIGEHPKVPALIAAALRRA